MRTWATGKAGDGAYSDSAITISPNPKMREVSTHDIAGSGGRYEQGDLAVGPFTPAFTGPPAGGYTPDQLQPPVPPGSRGVEVIYTVTGPDAGQYTSVTSSRDRPMRYSLVLRRLTGQRRPT